MPLKRRYFERSYEKNRWADDSLDSMCIVAYVRAEDEDSEVRTAGSTVLGETEAIHH